MNFLKAIVSCVLLCVSFAKASEFTIRAAQEKDYPLFGALCNKVMNEDFKRIITNGYPDSPIAQNSILLDEYLNAIYCKIDNLFYQTIHSPQEDTQQLLIAVDEQKPENIIGLCLSQKRDSQAYIRYILVDKNYRKKGLGRALLAQSIPLHKNVTSCSLRTFAYANEDVQKFYEKCGFISDKEAAPLPTKHTEHSDTTTFVLYKLNIR